jgi:hypothetical protein
MKSVSSIWKAASASPQVPQKKLTSQSNDNLVQPMPSQATTPQMFSKPPHQPSQQQQQQQQQHTFYQPQFVPSQLKTSIYQPTSTLISSSSNYQQFHSNSNALWNNASNANGCSGANIGIPSSNSTVHVPTIMSNGNKKLMENNLISKSIESVYSPMTASKFSGQNGNNNNNNNNQNGSGAFNAVKKPSNDSNSNGSGNGGNINNVGGTSTPQDNTDKEIQIMFQPVNFTNSRPKQFTPMSQQQQQHQQPGQYLEQMQHHMHLQIQQQMMQQQQQLMQQQMQQQLQQQQQQQQYTNPNSAFTMKNPSNFKRDIIAEKKRSSIGKYPHNNGNYVTIQQIQTFIPNNNE